LSQLHPVCECRALTSPKPDYSHLDCVINGLDSSISSSDKSDITRLLRKHADVFSRNEYDLGDTGLAMHTIDTGDHAPIRQSLRRQPYAVVPIIDEQVTQMLKAGVIEPSNSPWVANVVIVKKKDGSSRFCVDYRQLNEITRGDAYPLPNISACLDALSGSRFYSTFDLR
jgi:hypothetical protein